jgi:hypothetical protein
MGIGSFEVAKLRFQSCENGQKPIDFSVIIFNFDGLFSI